jgi:hypothetical protein
MQDAVHGGPGVIAISTHIMGSPARRRTNPITREAARHDAGAVYFIVEPDQDALRSIAELVDSGRLRPALDRVLPSPKRPQGVRGARDGQPPR